MSFRDQDGWPVDLSRLPSWDRRSERVHIDDAIFKFFACPCTYVPGGKRRPHRISTCDYLGTLKREDTPDVMLQKRMRVATSTIEPARNNGQ